MSTFTLLETNKVVAKILIPTMSFTKVVCLWAHINNVRFSVMQNELTLYALSTSKRVLTSDTLCSIYDLKYEE